MGYVMATSPCFGCGGLFSYNPNKVPSIRIEGVRQPVCRACMDRVNEMRRNKGVPEHPISPDAYEPLNEAEL